jgi:hypothetical protein
VFALHRFAHALTAVEALPPTADPTRARTAGITLGAPIADFEALAAATEAIRTALEVQRRRLAARTAHLVLDRAEVPALDRLLQAITASDVDAIERVLDDRLASHIQQLLATA